MLQCDFQYQHADLQLHIQLQLERNILGIIGPSGAGKSTVLKCIAGLLNPNEGNIQLGHNRLFDSALNINMPMHRRKIALIFQQALLFPHMNVQQNLKYAEKLRRDGGNKFSFDQVTDLLELKPLIQRKAHQLSGGEAQRVSIGRALLSSPDLLLLDEPLSGLDARLKNQILPFLKQIKDETALPMIYVTHHHEELDYLQADTLHLTEGASGLKVLASSRSFI